MTEINWGYNCLTSSIHHGRPEALWNLPLLHASHIFSAVSLKALVLARIYNDALGLVEFGEEPRPTEQWADRVKAYAEAEYLRVLQAKVGELVDYYNSSRWENEIRMVAEWYKNGQLNPNYKPLHSHDSINMLCRILGTSSSIKATNDGQPIKPRSG